MEPSNMPENRAVLTRSAPPPDRTLRYGAGSDHLADVWDAPERAAPLVILWHGGFWRAAFDRTHLRPMANALRDAGFTVATPEYRRSGSGAGADGGWPGTFDDVALACDRLPELLRADGIAVGSIVHVGHSAGGHLAVWAARRHCQPVGSPWRRESGADIVGVVALAPVLDLAEAYRLDLDEGAVLALLGGGPDERPERYDAADPRRLGGAAPPVVILHGDNDRWVPISLSRRFASAGFGTLEELPGADHFAVIDPESAVWPRVVRAVRLLSISARDDDAQGRRP